MRLQNKSYSKVKLIDILTKRKKTLKMFLKEMGIVTFESLKMRCNNMGVLPPSQKEYDDAMGNPVIPEISSPTEGIVVLSVPQEETFPSKVEEQDFQEISSISEKVFRKKKKSSEIIP